MTPDEHLDLTEACTSCGQVCDGSYVVSSEFAKVEVNQEAFLEWVTEMDPFPPIASWVSEGAQIAPDDLARLIDEVRSHDGQRAAQFVAALSAMTGPLLLRIGKDSAATYGLH